jgi:hypothetical protein
MKKISVLFLLPLFAFNFIADWQPVRLDDRITVLFPVKPQEAEMSGNKVWIADLEGNTRCMAMIMDFGMMGLDSAQMVEEFSRPDAFEEFRNSILAQMENASLLKERDTTANGNKSFEFDIDMGGDTLALNYMYNRNQFIGTKMVVLNYFERTRTEKNEVREKFFKSLKVN